MRGTLDGSRRGAGRPKRDLWLAAAAFALAVRALLGLVEMILSSAWYGFPESSLGGTNFVLVVVGGLVASVAFAMIGIALAGSAASRRSRWKPGWLLLGVAFVLSFAGMSISIYSAYTTPIDGGYPYHSGTFLTSYVIEAAAELWLAASAVLVALLFVRSPGRSLDRLLGWVATGFAVVWGISMLHLLAFTWGPWGPQVMEWNGIGWLESIFRFAAAVIAAVAFFRAARVHQFASTASFARRERGLAIAALSFLVAYTLGAGGPRWAGLAWRERVLDLLRTLPGVAIAVAALLVMVGFWMS